MKGLFRLLVVCLMLGKEISRAEETSSELEGNVSLRLRNYCAPKIWDIFTLVYGTRLPTVPCHTNYRRLEFPEDEENEEGDKYDSAGVGILGSLENLTYWAMREEIIFDLVEERLRSLRQEVKIMEEYVEDYTSSTKRLLDGSKTKLRNAKDRGEMVAKSGIAAYRMTHRYVETLQKIKEFVAKDLVDTKLNDALLAEGETEDGESYDRRFPGEVFYNWPNKVDLGFAMQSLIQIQEIYGFNFSDLPGALALESKYPPQLTAVHCKDIGVYALYMQQFDLAVIWIEEAISKVIMESDSSVTLASLEVYLELVAYQHNEAHRKAYGGDDREETTNNIFTNLVQPFALEERETLSQATVRVNGPLRGWNDSQMNFNSLCAGNEFQTDAEKAELKCWYDWNSHPYWRIGPLKKERLAFNPPVVQVYDILGERDISDIQYAASEDRNFRTSVVVGVQSSLEATKARTSVNSWVTHEQLPLLEKKIEFLSGLDTDGPDASEQLQVVEYVYGRLYLPHPDAFQPVDEEDPETMEELKEAMADMGDRVMTLLFYLNDVIEGGGTPFCDAGITAKPVKGSAIMWENLHRNGSVRHDTWHGACPVLYGHKIIANKWIRYNKQFQKFKCTLNQFE